MPKLCNEVRRTGRDGQWSFGISHVIISHVIIPVGSYIYRLVLKSLQPTH